MCSISFSFSLLSLASLLSASFNPGNNGNNQGYDPRQGYNPYQGFPGAATYQQHNQGAVGAYQNYPGYPGQVQHQYPQVQHQHQYQYAPPMQHQPPQYVQQAPRNQFVPPPPTHIPHCLVNQFMTHMTHHQAAPTGNFQSFDIVAMRSMLMNVSTMLETFLQVPQRQQHQEMDQTTQTQTTPMLEFKTKEDDDEPMSIKETDDAVLFIPNVEEKSPEPRAAADYTPEACLPDVNHNIEIQEQMFPPHSPIRSSSSSEGNVLLEPFMATAMNTIVEEPLAAADITMVQEPFFAIVIETETAQPPHKVRSLHSRRLPSGEEKKPERKEKKKQPKKTEKTEKTKDSKKRKRDTDKVAKAPVAKKHHKKLDSELKDLAYTYERRDDHLNALGRTRQCKEKAVAKIKHHAIIEAPIYIEREEKEMSLEEQVEEKEPEPFRPIAMMRPRGYVTPPSSSSEEDVFEIIQHHGLSLEEEPKEKRTSFIRNKTGSSSSSSSDDVEIVPRPTDAQNDHDAVLALLNLTPSDYSKFI